MEQTQIKTQIENICFQDQDGNWFYYQTGAFIVSKEQFKAKIKPIADEIVPYLDDMPSNMILADYEVYLEGYVRFVIDCIDCKDGSFSNIDLKPDQLKAIDLTIVEIGKNLEISIQLECWKSSIEIKEEWLETQY